MTKDYGLKIFRRLPGNIGELNPLLSSFQSFETSLELIALRRYPAAVIACTNAWESAIKSYLNKGPEDETKLYILIDEVFKKKSSLKKYEKEVSNFRGARNSLAHFGASPGDDQKSYDLLFSIGMSFYANLIRECFGLYLNWRELAPDVQAFHDIGEQVEGKCVLIPMYGDAIFEAIALHKEFRFNKLIKDNRFCAARLEYMIGNLIKYGFYEAKEEFAEYFSDDYYKYLSSIRNKVEALYDDWFYNFNCPVCTCDQFIGEVDKSRTTKKTIHIDRGHCVECGFSIGAGNKGVLNRLLKSQLEEKAPAIKKEFKGYI